MASAVSTTATLLNLIMSVDMFCNNCQLYEEFISLRNQEIGNFQLATIGGLTIAQCAKRCFQEPSCHLLGLKGGDCYLYAGEEIRVSGLDPGIIYFGENDRENYCPESKGYTLMNSPRLCYKYVETIAFREDSEAACNADWGRLIVLSDDRAFDLIQALIPVGKTAWVGMELIGDTLTWIGGSTRVRQWGGSTPRVHSCVVLHQTTGLADVFCSGSSRASFCEIAMLV